MFDYSMEANAIRIINEGAAKALSQEELLKREIIDWKHSQKYKWMVDGQNYFSGRQEILHKKRTAIGKDGSVETINNLPNNKQINNIYQKMVKQKVNYLLGKPYAIKSDNEDYSKELHSLLGKRFAKDLKNIGKDMLNCGIAYVYVYYNEKAEFKIERMRPWEIIPGWRDKDHTDLEYFIHFYDLIYFDGDDEKILTKVEYYSKDGIDYYEMVDGSLYSAEPYHTDYLSVGNETYNWDNIPLVAFKYNDEELPLIVNAKSLQDGYNRILSNFEDNMEEDARNTILVLVNYDGQNLGEFRRNLSAYGAVKVRSADGSQGGVQTLQVEVNSDNYKAILDIFKKAIIENCMGYDAKDERMNGTPNQMNIMSMYNDIDMDARDMALEIQTGLEQLMEWINIHLFNTGHGDYTKEIVDFVFNTDMPMDETNKIQNIQASVGIVSQKTLLANHPWVENVEQEIDQLEKEKANNDPYADLFEQMQSGNQSNKDNND